MIWNTIDIIEIRELDHVISDVTNKSVSRFHHLEISKIVNK